MIHEEIQADVIPIKKISSHWKQMLTWEDFGVSIAIIMMFKDLKEKLGILPEQMGNFGQETVTKKKPNGSSRIEQYNGWNEKCATWDQKPIRLCMLKS